MKRLLITLSIFLGTIFALGSVEVYADNRIHSIDIYVELMEDGSAVVHETREMTVDEGTELFIDMTNLQDSEVSDFEVAGFEYNPVWDSDDSLEEKTGTYGLIFMDEGSELVWGMGEHGDKTYELTYTLTNLVRNLEDGQGMLWNFDTFLGIPTDELTLTIDSPLGLTQDNTNFWGFGFDGDLQMIGDQIIWTAEECLDRSNYVTVLAQFPPNLFNANVAVDMSLDEQREMALDGSAYNEAESGPVWIPFLIMGLVFIPTLLILGAIFIWMYNVRKIKRENNHMITGHERLKRNKDRPSSKVPDYGHDIGNVAYLLQELNVGNFEDYFAAYLIKWLAEERIDIETFAEKKLFGEKYTTYIHIKNYTELDRSVSFRQWLTAQPIEEWHFEEGMWLMLLDSADRDGTIDSVTMQEWGRDHADDVKDFDEILKASSLAYLSDKGYLKVSEHALWGRPVIVTEATVQGEALFDQIAQFKVYLEDLNYTQIQASSNLADYSELISWSILVGAADKLSKQFDDVMPMKEAYSDDYGYYYAPHYWHSTMHFRHGWSTGLSSGGYNSTVAGGGSDGSGGSTSSGGGGGAGGGGGGGAR